MNDKQVIIIGGGIAGVSCADELLRITHQNHKLKIILITTDHNLKISDKNEIITEHLIKYEICLIYYKKWIEKYNDNINNISVLIDKVININHHNQIVYTQNKKMLYYDELVLCCGGIPQLISDNRTNERLISIRDTTSINKLSNVIKDARRIILVGNGGIAMEVSYALRNYNILWAIKDMYMCNVFLDRESSAFIMPRLFPKSDPTNLYLDNNINPTSKNDMNDNDKNGDINNNNSDINNNKKSYVPKNFINNESKGASLGPNWLNLLDNPNVDLKFHDRNYKSNMNEQSNTLQLKFGVYIQDVIINENDNNHDSNSDWPLSVVLSDGKTNETYYCDYIISATGVIPNTDFLPNELKRGDNNGILINERMETSINNIYAAGDCCDCDFQYKNDNKNWFQMRLWSQAEICGRYCARRICNEYDPELGFYFGLFSHITQFFGIKVVLLGRFKGEHINEDCKKVLVRCKPNIEFIKLYLENNRLVGAILIGETDMEETFENLILNELDLSIYGNDLLNDQIDLADYFD